MADKRPNSSTTLDALESLINIAHDRLNESPLKSTRCLFTTTIVMYFAERMGFEARRWEGSVRWFSRKYVELIDQGYEFGNMDKLSPEKSKKRAEALRKRGVRVLECMANEGNPEDLGGHLCLTVRNEQQAFFVDPTAYQFRREDTNPGGRIYAPMKVILPIDYNDFGKEKDLLYRKKFVAGVYEYEPVNKYQTLLNFPEHEKANTDLNPFRHETLYHAIEKDLVEAGLLPK